MLCLPQTCLNGFNTSTDCHRLIFPDAMHNTSSGLLKHLLDLTEIALKDSSQHEDIQERLKLVPSFMELHLPAKRLAAKDITAAQRHSLGACMPVCLVGLVDMEPYIAAFTGMAAQQCLRPPCMTAASSQLTTTNQPCVWALGAAMPPQAQQQAHFCVVPPCGQPCSGMLACCLDRQLFACPGQHHAA